MTFSQRPTEVPAVDAEGKVADEYRRAVRWLAIQDRVRQLGDYAAHWLRLQSPIHLAVQRILEQARSAEARIMEALRASQEKEARTRRAETAWRRVASFKGDAIPKGLTGKPLWRHYAELIVELGQVLRNDGWQADVDAIAPGPTAKAMCCRAAAPSDERRC
jgi:hypothetical protein